MYPFLAIARSKENPGLTSGSATTFREVVTDEAGLRRKYDRLRRATRGYRANSGESLTFRRYRRGRQSSRSSPVSATW